MKDALPISILGLCLRTQSLLERRGVCRVGQITRMNIREFVGEFGRQAWHEVDRGLTELGVRFQPGPSVDPAD